MITAMSFTTGCRWKGGAKLTENTYFVRGCTVLLDAVGGAIHHIGNIHKYARDEDRPEKTLFIISSQMAWRMPVGAILTRR